MNQGNASLIDIVIMAWLALGALGGLKSGLFRTLTRVVGYFLAIYLAGVYAASVAHLLDERLHVARFLAGIIGNQHIVPMILDSQPASALPMDKLPQVLEQAHVPASQRDLFVSWWQGATAPGPGGQPPSIAGAIYVLLGRAVTQAVAFTLVFAVVGLVVEVVGRMLQETVGRLPAFALANRLGGLGLGLAQSALFLALFLGMVVPLADILPVLGWARHVQDSALAAPFLSLFRWVGGMAPSLVLG